MTAGQIGRFLHNKRAVSSLFIAIFLALFAIILVTTLFVGLSISHSSLSNYLRLEQDKSQEKILIGYNSLTVNLTSNTALSLIVNNTGAITARIRSLYIDGKFICDPSTFGPSYIAPQHTLSIQLTTLNPPIYLNDTTLERNWTVTTERGSKSSDTGENLWLGPRGGAEESNMFYFGPLRLEFNDFKWSSDWITWNDGWRIPEQTQNVIWRINVTDIDERPIALNYTSSFSLIQNGQTSKIRIWYISA